MKSAKRFCILAAVVTVLVAPLAARADPTFYTSEAAWTAAIAAIDAAAIFGGENFNGVAVDGATLGAGPHSYGGGAFDVSLNDIGNFSSKTGVINPADFDASNALQVRLVLDSSDLLAADTGLPFDLLGEGVESMDFAFGTAVIGFAARWESANTHDSVKITVNGVDFDFELSDHLPDNNLNDGDGFFGFVDDALFSSFTIVSGVNDVNAEFEEFEMDAIQFATPMCDDDAGCNDGDVCTQDQCINGSCQHTAGKVYGDVNNDNVVDVFDLFCILNCFSNDFSVCSFEKCDLNPCEGDVIVDVFDLFALLNAFSGVDPCCGG